MEIEVKKDVLIPAPAKNVGCWAVNPCYTSRDGLAMVMTVVKRISDGTEECNWRKRTSTVHRMASPDNGASWAFTGESMDGGTYESGNRDLAWCHFLDPDNGLLLSIHMTSRRGPAADVPVTRLYYRISRDAGKSWESPRQIIHPGKEFNETLWMPAIAGAEQYIGVDQGPFAKLDDGTIVFGITVHIPSKYFPVRQPCSVVFLRGKWRDDGRAMIWDVGDVIQVPISVSQHGVCEPDLIYLGGQRLLTTLRCQGDPEPHILSTRQWALSEDGGRTWTEPQPLKYDDGSMVCVPASKAAFENDPRTGAAYWFANILDKPVTGQSPRYPLTIAEFDTNRVCVIKDSVSVIQGFPEGAPADRAYTNFGHYVDRVTGEFVLTMMEAPKFNWIDLTSDCIRYRVRIKGSGQPSKGGE